MGTHRLTTAEHWDDLLVQPFKTKEELAYENYVEPGTVITPSYDPHCVNMDITEGCQPVEVISADRLRNYTEGAAETAKNANVLVRLLKEHLASVEAELEDINTGVRVLRKQDFLGPEERARMQDLASKPSNEHEKKAHSRYFFALEQKRYEAKRKQALHTRKTSKEVHDADFINILSDALKNIRTLESAGGMDRKRASELAERVEKVAQVVFPEGF